jgi:hypothetical protein
MNGLFDYLPSPEPQRSTLEGCRIDPAGLSFSEYRDRCLWGPPEEHGRQSCLDRKTAMEPFDYIVTQRDNYFKNGEDPHYGTWDKALEAGRSYLVGNAVPWSQFLRTHASALTGWQRMAYRWCLANPSLQLVCKATLRSRIYHVMKRGDYVEIGLPFHDYGGEKHWISRDGKTKVLVNVD